MIAPCSRPSSADWHCRRRFAFAFRCIVLLASIGLTALAVVDAQRAVRSQQDVTRRALREYATFAAWSYAQHLNEVLVSLVRESLGAVNHGDNMHTSRRIPEARELAHYLPWDVQCMCHRARNGPNPSTFFALKIGSDRLDVGVEHPQRSDGRLGGGSADARAARDGIRRRLLA